MVKALLVRLELNQQIHIAFTALPTMYEGTEQSQPLHTKGSDPSLVLTEDVQNILLG